MILEDIRKIKSDPKGLRNFGLTMAGALAVLGGLLLWKGSRGAPWVFALGGFFLAFGLLRPRLLKPIHKAWMSFAVVLGWIMTWVLMTALFYAILTPIGLILRLSGKDLLEEKFDKGAPTYWKRRPPVAEDKDRHLRQF